MRNVSDKSCREKQDTLFIINIPPPTENHAVNDIMWKNVAEPDRPRMKIWRMRVACWILNATNTHSDYAIFIVFPQQQWLNKLASMLRTYIICLMYLVTTSLTQNTRRRMVLSLFSIELGRMWKDALVTQLGYHPEIGLEGVRSCCTTRPQVRWPHDIYRWHQ